jgi:enediyne biosynthesis protein E3
MPVTGILRALRRRILTPSISQTSPDVRGFYVKNDESRAIVENVGRSFLSGYGHLMAATSIAAAEEPLEAIPVRFRGFAYEGAAMAAAMLDGLPFGGRGRFGALLAGRGAAHVYMAYVGLGWAMARLPRYRWPAADEQDPLLRWLVLDGYGFHQAFFKTTKYVHDQVRETGLNWPAGYPGEYPLRVLDQGIGRAMWFVGGTDAQRVADLVDRFPAGRRADLYSGAALAATYAGGAGRSDLEGFAERAGEHRGVVAQGSAFAAEARLRAGLLVPHTAVATDVFCGTGPEEAAAVTQRLRPADPVDGSGTVPHYEIWRQAVAAEYVTLGGVST